MKSKISLYFSVAILSVCCISLSIAATSENLSSDIESQSANQFKQPKMLTIANKQAFNAVIADEDKLKAIGTQGIISQHSKKITIHKPNASFLKIHFSQFNIPTGSYVKVRNPDATQVHQYGGQNQSSMTNNLQEGDNGVSQFSALSIIGDTAVVEFYKGSSHAKSYQVSIDYVMQGIASDLAEQASQAESNSLQETRSTCGVNERRDTQCWATSNPIEFERARPVARLLINGSGLCTAWRVGSSNHMFTNNHCIATQADLTNSEVWFNYQNTACGSGTLAPTTIVTGSNLFKTDYTLDYTLFSVSNFSSIAAFGYFGLDVRDAITQELIYIPQHGSGNPKELAIESDQNTGGLCRVDDPFINGRGTDSDIGYMCDTIGGSSGSPVLAGSTNRVIGLHHFGGCLNQGVRVGLIWPQVSTYFGGQIPSGDNETPGGNPIANFSFSVNTLQVSFTDSSSDPDGNIVSHSWDFGDGTSSTAQNPTHTYSSAGAYSVTLTVLDNDGKSNAKTQTINVSTGGEGKLTKGVAKTGIGASQGTNVSYWIDVPANQTNLTFDLSGGTGDADLYVRFGSEPTTSTYDCRPYKNGNVENCTFATPQVGRYYVMIRAYSTFSGAQLIANHQDKTSGNKIEHPNLAGSTGNWKHYTIQVASGMTSLNATITGGTGDADLYVRSGAEPTTSSYNCRPYKNGNEETCSINNPQVGTWYISVRAYSSYSGVTLTGEAL